MKTLLLITDTYNDVNGVTTTYRSILPILATKYNIRTIVLDPVTVEGKKIPCPRYPQLHLKFPSMKEVNRLLDQHGNADFVHIATEGPIGRAFAKGCRKRGIPYTTAYHTNFPKYIRKMFYIPEWITRRNLTQFHARSRKIFVPNMATRKVVESWGWKNTVAWTRGVDTLKFRPKPKKMKPDPNKPICLYVGRISQEKNLEEAFRAFPNMLVVGDGPMLETYRKKYPTVTFVGEKRDGELATAYQNADFFIFPSKTDTFGVVMLEALASGLPVIAAKCDVSESILQDFPFSMCVDSFVGVVERWRGVYGSVHPDVVSDSNRNIIDRKYTWERVAAIFQTHLCPNPLAKGEQ